MLGVLVLVVAYVGWRVLYRVVAGGWDSVPDEVVAPAEDPWQ